MSYAAILTIHLLAATVWTGGHLVLFFAVLLPALKDRDVARISAFERHYEKIGIPALVTLVVTGVWLALRQAADMSQWFSAGTTISRTVIAKLILLAMTLVLAVHARLKIIPALSAASLNSLAVHITGVTLLAVLFALTGVLHRFGGIW